MKIYSITFLTTALFFTACSSSQPANTATNSTVNPTANSTTSTNAATVNTGQTAPPKVAAQSPTDAMKALNEASKTNDVAAIKGLISKGTIALLEESAKEKQTTVDELLQRDDSMPFEDIPEMRNEKITGDKATLEIKNTLSGEYSTVPFVKEDGSWRIAFDIYLKEIEEKMRKQMGNQGHSDEDGHDHSADAPKGKK
ncbi:MAG: hypothetical protein LUM44_07040 [Pyrinomonadaceae bacterium]|nr:hypothetical protein [Pyrinomonadaceae bacterium]